MTIFGSVFLAGTVWLIYVADRLLDARKLGADDRMTARHAFYLKHGRLMKVSWVIVLVTLALLAPYYLPSGLLVRGIFLLGFVGLYFVFVTGTPSESGTPFLKELLCGFIFAMGSTVAVGFYTGLGSNPDLLTGTGLIREWMLHVMDMSAYGMPMFAFAILCAMNCASINVWEGEVKGFRVEEKRGLREVMLLAAVGAGIWAAWEGSRFSVIYGCVALSAAGLALLHHFEKKLSPDALRVLADVVLLTPLAGMWLVE